MSSVNFYELLQVSQRADQEIIQAAYRRLTLRHHPDRAPGNPDAEKMMKALNAAYEVLSDPVRRRQYDAEIGVTSTKSSDPHPPDQFSQTCASAQKAFDEKNYSLAVKMFTEVIDNGFTFPIVFAMRAAAHEQLNNMLRAIADFSTACKLDPTNEGFKEALKRVQASQRREKAAARQKPTENVLNKARRQTQQMATFKITPPDLRRRVLNQSNPLCPLSGYRGNEGAVQAALDLAAQAFDAHVDIGLAAGKWHEPIWACSRDVRARMLLTGPPNVAARFAEDFAAVVSMDWDEQCRPIPFAMEDERPAKPTPNYVTWKLPWTALNGSTVKKPEDILSALERACRGKGLPLLPLRTEGGVRHYRLPPLCMFINNIEAVPTTLMNWLMKMADAEDGVVGLSVFDKIDWRPATIIVATPRPGVLNAGLLARFPTRLALSH